MRQTIIILFSVCFCLNTLAEDSRSALEDSVYQTKKKFDYFFLESLRLKENNRHSEAFATLQYALKTDSTSSATLALLANYYMFLQKDSLAVEALEKAVKYSPQNFDYKVSLAEIYREIGNIAKSTMLYESLVAEQPAKPELNFYLSELYLRQNNIDKAIQSLDALENAIGMNEALTLQKSRLYLTINQIDKAIGELERLSAKNPFEAKYQIIIGDFFLENEEPDMALEYYNKAKKIEPQNPYYIISMANYYEKMGDKEAAIKEIEAALINQLLDVDTKISILSRHISNLLSNKKDTESVNSLFITLMEQHSQETELNLLYGQFLLSQEKWEEAKFHFQIVTEANPENFHAWRLLIDIAIKEDKPEEIIRICNSALAIFPENSEFVFFKGSAHYQLKNYQEALNVFLEGVLLIPEEEKGFLSIFYGQIGDLYYHLNNKKDAYIAFDKALEYNENNVNVLNNYAYFLSLDKEELDKAEYMIGKCVKMQPKSSTYLDTYAWVYFQKGNYSLAKFYIESAISNGGGSSAEILEHYGDILFNTGNKDKAFEQWERAFEARDKDEDTTLLKKKIENQMYYEK